MKKVMVCGGAGYLGSVLVNQLIKTGFSVLVVDNFSFGNSSAPYKNKNLEIRQGDIRNLPEKLLDGVFAIINLVALSNDKVCDLFPGQAREINVDGAVKLAETAKKIGVERYLFASTCAVYGYGFDLAEDSPYNPQSNYARLKLEAEKLLNKISNSSFSVTHLRNGTLFGLSPKMRFDLMVNIMTLNAFRDGLINIDGSGRQWRPLTHVEDTAQAFVSTLLAEKKVISSQVFNVVSENAQVVQVSEKIKSLLPHVKVLFAGIDDHRSYSVSNGKIIKAFGFRKTKSIEKGMEEILYALENGKTFDGPQSRVVETYKDYFTNQALNEN